VFNSKLGPILHRFRDTATYRSKNRQNRPFVPTPVSEIALARGDPLRIFGRVIPRQRVRSWGYQMVKKSWRYLFPFWYNTGVWQTDVSVAKTRSTLSVARVKILSRCVARHLGFKSWGQKVEIFRQTAAKIRQQISICSIRTFTLSYSLKRVDVGAQPNDRLRNIGQWHVRMPRSSWPAAGQC